MKVSRYPPVQLQSLLFSLRSVLCILNVNIRESMLIMYFSANKYPELSKMNSKLKGQCLKYCLKKTKIAHQFSAVVIAIIFLSIIWGLWLEEKVLGNNVEPYGFIFPFLIGVVFWLYLLAMINLSLHKAVKKYINEFENISKSNLGE